jgi:hypothetical protein
MLTDEDVQHYRTFGFVVLRKQLDQTTVTALAAEVDRAFVDALGDHFRDRPDEGGIRGHYLPVMSTSRTPVSIGLVEHFHMVGQRLLGGRVLPAPAEAILFFDQAPWHDDTGFEVHAVKFAAYLEPLQASTGALRVLPGSQLDSFRTLARDFDRRVMAQRSEEIPETVERLPGYVIETEPGDVIAFDLRLYHASIRGTDRRQWTVTCYLDIEEAAPASELADALADEVAPDDGSWGHYDPQRYPFYDPAWIARAEQDWRAPALRRLRELGVLEAAAKSERAGR